MKHKLLLFVGVSIAFTVAIYLVFLIFNIISGDPRGTEGREIKFAILVGILSSIYMVFFTKFFERKNK